MNYKKQQLIYIGHVISAGGFGLYILLFLVPAIIPPHSFVYDYNMFREAWWEIPIIFFCFLFSLVTVVFHWQEVNQR